MSKSSRVRFCHFVTWNIHAVVFFYIIFTALSVFHTNVSWWLLTVLWVRGSLLKTPGLFSVFWPTLVMVLSGWSLLVLVFPRFPVPLPILREFPKCTYQTWYHCCLHVPWLLQLSKKVQIFIPLLTLKKILFCGLPERQSLLFGRFSNFMDYH